MIERSHSTASARRIYVDAIQKQMRGSSIAANDPAKALLPTYTSRISH